MSGLMDAIGGLATTSVRGFELFFAVDDATSGNAHLSLKAFLAGVL